MTKFDKLTLQEVKQRLGQNIKNRRIQLGLSQAELAFKMGIDPRYISLIENAKYNPSIEYLYNIAKALDIEYQELFYLS